MELRRRGETDDPAVNILRERQLRNFFTTLFLSQGVPMLMAGDELARTQEGNNNAYCQDNELCWLDWDARRAGRNGCTRSPSGSSRYAASIPSSGARLSSAAGSEWAAAPPTSGGSGPTDGR